MSDLQKNSKAAMPGQESLAVQATPESVGMAADLPQRIQSMIDREYLSQGKLVGALTLVARHGKIVALVPQGMACRENKVEMREDALFRIYSMTKPMTSIAVMQLYEQGKLLLEDPLSRFLPAYKTAQVWAGGSYPDFTTRPAEREICLHDLLTHTSGLTYEFMHTDNVDHAYRKIKAAALMGHMSLVDYVNKLAELPLAFSPGAAWNYSRATDVLGAVVEIVSGQPFEQYLQEHIFAPLGMADTGFSIDPSQSARMTSCYEQLDGKVVLQDLGSKSQFLQAPKAPSGGGGLVSSLCDYYRFSAALLNGGVLEEKRIIGSSTLRYMTSNQLPKGADMIEYGVPGQFSEVSNAGVGFGLGFSVVQDPAASQGTCRIGDFGWGGMASTAFWVSPQEELVTIFMAQLMPSSTHPIRRQLKAVVHGAIED